MPTRLRTSRWPSVAGCILLLSGCDIFGPDERRVLGSILITKSEEEAFVVPATAQAGEAFTVQVVTDVGCFIRPGAVDVRIDDRTATLTPYDIEDLDDDFCLTLPPTPHTHEVELLFEEAGEVHVILRAMNGLTEQPVELTRTVQVN